LAAADCVSLLNDDTFVTGHEDGTLGLWVSEKKRAMSMMEAAHGYHHHHHRDGSSAGMSASSVARGITSLDCLKGSDLAASGSCDGHLRLWKVQRPMTTKRSDTDEPCMQEIATIPNIRGYINDIAIGPRGRFCVVAVGQEPRLGRWGRVANAKNRFAIITLRRDTDDDAEDDEEEGSDGPKTKNPAPSSTSSSSSEGEESESESE